MTRAFRHFRIVYFEEPVLIDGEQASLRTRVTEKGVLVATPQLPTGLDAAESDRAVRGLLNDLLSPVGPPEVAWYFTPRALVFPATSSLQPASTTLWTSCRHSDELDVLGTKASEGHTDAI